MSAAGGSSRPRLAYLSPLPPQPSGIADYSAELLPHLARHFELELFPEPGEAVAPVPGGRAGESLPVRSLKELPRLHAAGRYDAVLYQLGNHPAFHGEIYRTLLAIPGIVVLHETMLHHLVQGITVAREAPGEYLETMRYCYGDSGLAAARRHLESGLPVDVWSYPLFERAVDASLGVIVHSETARRRVLASRPAARIARVPHHLSLPPEVEAMGREEARRGVLSRLRLPEDALLVASFGLMTPQKRLDVALRAFARLRRVEPRAVYLLVGEISPFYNLDELLRDGLGDGVVITGRVDLESFAGFMRGCDLAVNLRYPSGGETSGSLLRLLGLGKAVAVSNEGSFAEIPAGCAAHVDLDADEEEVLFALLERLARDEPLRRALGENARRHVRAHHAIERSAALYARHVQAILATAPAPYRPAPPLAPCPGSDLLSALAGRLGAELADLGLDAVAGEGGEPGAAGEDEELLAALAETLVDLDLDLELPEAS